MTEPPFWSYSGSKLGNRKKSWWCYKKLIGVQNQSHPANFGQIAWKRIQPGVPILEPMFYSFQSDQTKIGGVTFFLDTTIAARTILKRRSTLAAPNSALNTLYPPLQYIFWTFWTWELVRYHLMCNIPIKKIEQIAIECSFFGDFLGLIKRKWRLIVMSDFYALYHFVCNRYT